MKASKYIPLDEILEQPATRILRALRHFDWVRGPDLFAALEVPDFSVGKKNPERDRYSAALSRLVKDGLVERSTRAVDGFLNRITKAGRVSLANRLQGTEGCGRDRRRAA